MAQSGNGVAHIAVIAHGAGIGGIAFLSTGGLGHNSLIGVGHHFHFMGFGLITMDAASLVLTLFGAGGSLHLRPGAEGMTLGSNDVVNIVITAHGAGISGIAFLSTGGLGHNRLIRMGDLFQLAGLGIATDRANPLLLTHFDAGRCLGLEPIAEGMLGLGDFLALFQNHTTFTDGIASVAGCLTGRCLGILHMGHAGMGFGVHRQDLHMGFAAISTGKLLFTGRAAGGSLGHFTLVPLVLADFLGAALLADIIHKDVQLIGVQDNTAVAAADAMTGTILIIGIDQVMLTVGGDDFRLLLTAKAAGVGQQTGLTASLILGSGHPVVTQGRHFIGNVGIATDASIGSIAIFCTGGLGHNSVVRMVEHCDLTGLGITTTRAVSLLLALFRAGGSLDLSPFAKVMAQCIHLIGNIAVAAGTSVSGITALGAGGLGHNSLILVGNHSDVTALDLIAAGAVSLLLALYGAGGSLHLDPFAKVMAQCIHLIGNIAVAADTSVSGISALGAGGLGHNILVLVSDHFHFSGFNLSTSRADALLCTLLGAGRSLGLDPIAEGMSGHGDFLTLFQNHAAFTDSITGVAGGFTGGSHGVFYMGYAGVGFRINLQNIHISFAAEGTSVLLFAGGHAGGGFDYFAVIPLVLADLLGAAQLAYAIYKAMLLLGIEDLTAVATADAMGRTIFIVGVNQVMLAVGRDHLGLSFTTAATDFGQQAVLTASFRLGGDHPIMAQSVHFIFNIGITTGAGIGGVAFLGAGGFGHNSLILVAGHIHFTGLSLVAAGANSLLLALFGAGRCLHLSPFAEVMAQGIHLVVNIAVTAGAGIGSIATLSAGRFGHDRLIGMFDHVHFPGLNMTATLTATLLLTLFGAGRCLHLNPGIKGMAQSRQFVTHITIAAGAGIGSVAILGTGRMGHNSRIAMTGSSHNTGFLQTTALAAALFLTCFRTSGRNCLSPATKVMLSGSRNRLLFPLGFPTTTGTIGHQIIAAVSTTGSILTVFLPSSQHMVTGSRDSLLLGLTAPGAGEPHSTVILTGGLLLYDTFIPGVVTGLGDTAQDLILDVSMAIGIGQALSADNSKNILRGLRILGGICVERSGNTLGIHICHPVIGAGNLHSQVIGRIDKVIHHAAQIHGTAIDAKRNILKVIVGTNDHDSSIGIQYTDRFHNLAKVNGIAHICIDIAFQAAFQVKASELVLGNVLIGDLLEDLIHHGLNLRQIFLANQVNPLFLSNLAYLSGHILAHKEGRAKVTETDGDQISFGHRISIGADGVIDVLNGHLGFRQILIAYIQSICQ